MSARYALLLCFALYGCKTSQGNSQSMDSAKPTDSGQTDDGGTKPVGTQPTDGGQTDDGGTSIPSAGGGDAGGIAATIPDDRSPTQIRDDLYIEQGVRRRLTECKLINRPDLPVGLERIRDEHGRCFGRCFLSSVACVDIWKAVCGTGDTALATECLDTCEAEPKDGFLCRGGARIPHIFLCDQTTDCPNGDDEGPARCASHTCKDGKVLKGVGDIVCDTLQDCSDGSDEVGCGYDCSTEPAPECLGQGAIRCDGYDDCTDGSDEKNCVDVRCDGGFNLVDAAQVCDGQKDCFDGADEKNCP